MLKRLLPVEWVVLVSLFSFLPQGCQDYGFEELPRSVIKEKRWSQTIAVSASADILFVVDNSGSMAGEQQQLGRSFEAFTGVLDEKFGGDYHIGVITTGMESPPICPKCSDLSFIGSCVNDTGENGRLQDELGYISQPGDPPTFEFITDSTCRVVTSKNKECFYDPSQNNGTGTALVGVTGCGLERGLAPLRSALGSLSKGWNDGFLRDEATLAVVIISDEDDCGEVGDIWEMSSEVGKLCYFASKGVGPDGETKYPGDPDPNRTYQLEPVETYRDFLIDVKNGREGMVKFAAVVGVNDADNNGEITAEDLAATTIEYQPDRDVFPACTTPDCQGIYCSAKPSTRYIKLAQLFGIGQNGFVDTICQRDFSKTMVALGNFVACPRQFKLSEQPLDPDLASILINGEQVPLYSCSIPNRLEVCSGPTDSGCSQGSCVLTWIYCANIGSAPECSGLDFSNAAGGVITFADHYDPCDLITEGEINIEFVYVPRG
jgi:hypothetical protein